MDFFSDAGSIPAISTIKSPNATAFGLFPFLLLHCQTNGVQNQIHRLFRSGFAGHNAIVIEIPDHGQVQHALPGVNVRDVRYPFAVWLACVKVPVHAKTAFPLLCNHFRKSCVLFRPAQTMDKSIAAASGHSKEFAHDCHWILCPVTIDDMILYLCAHFLFVKRRKSCSSLFSMRSRWIS